MESRFITLKKKKSASSNNFPTQKSYLSPKTSKNGLSLSKVLSYTIGKPMKRRQAKKSCLPHPPPAPTKNGSWAQKNSRGLKFLKKQKWVLIQVVEE